MKNFILLLFFYAIGIVANAQSNFKSIHQEENEYYHSLNLTYEDYVKINSKNAVNLNENTKTTNCTLNKVVYGWHPYWVNGSESAYQWDKLSHLSYFSYEVNPSTGNATTTRNWSTASVVSTAIANGVKVTLCVTLFSNHTTFFNSSTAQQTLINNLVSLVQARNAHGVNIDFEGMGASHRTPFANFMNNLADAFHTQIPGSDVSTVLYAVDWNGCFDINAMKSKVDKFIIMGYDYYYQGSTTAGPNDPLYHFGTTYNYTLSKSVNYYLNQGCPANKLILGLPYYGREYGTVSSTIPSSVNNAPNSASRTYTVIRNNSNGYYSAANARWDGESYTPYFVFNNGTEWRQCFYNNDYSMRRRMQMINQRGLGGMGIWALSYDNGYNEYWNAIRDNFTTCASAACSDSLFDMGGPAKNYYDNESYTYTIAPPNSAQLNLNFSQFSLGTGDTLWLYRGSSTNAPLIGAYTGTTSPGSLVINNPSFTLRFKSNGSGLSSGFKATYQCVADNTPPTTAIATNGGNWKTASFTATFTDADANSGVEKSFYNISDFNGSEWRANNQRGFFTDEFNSTSINNDWSVVNGTWSINNGKLTQTDATLTNTNIYAPLKQNLSNRYVYHWKGKIRGSGSNKRAGFHFFADDPTKTNRGNSYFVWFRENDDKAQIYRVKNDTFSLVKDEPFAMDTVWYDFKVSYDRISGDIKVYVNNNLVTTWKDNNPHSNGTHISFRTGNCIYEVDDFYVYRSRNATTTVTVGTGSSNDDIRYQNPSPNKKAGLIRSIVTDNASLLSTIAIDSLNIDWTPPLAPQLVNDSLNFDIDITSDSTQLFGNYSAAIDSNSGIQRYEFSIGTLNPGNINVLGWTNNNLDTVYQFLNAAMQPHVLYFVNVKAVNGAGLTSNVVSSNGVKYIPVINDPTALGKLDESIKVYPNPFTRQIVIEGIKAKSVVLFDATGREVNTELQNNGANAIVNIRDKVASGNYLLFIKDTQGGTWIEKLSCIEK